MYIIIYYAYDYKYIHVIVRNAYPANRNPLGALLAHR